jgi:hypothetical protein
MEPPFPWGRAIGWLVGLSVAVLMPWPLMLASLVLAVIWGVAWVLFVNSPGGTGVLNTLLPLLIGAALVALYWYEYTH